MNPYAIVLRHAAFVLYYLQSGSELSTPAGPGGASILEGGGYDEAGRIADSFLRQESCGGAATAIALPDQSQQNPDGKTTQVLIFSM